MTALLVAAGGAYGVHLAYTALALHWTGLGPGPRRTRVPAPVTWPWGGSRRGSA